MPWSDHEDHFFQTIQRRMNELGIDKATLSRMLPGGAPTYVGNLLAKKNRPRIDIIYALAEALQIPIEALINSNYVEPIGDAAARRRSAELNAKLARRLRHVVARQPEYHFIHEIWSAADSSLAGMSEAIEYLDIHLPLAAEPWLKVRRIGEITLSGAMLGSTNAALYQKEFDNSIQYVAKRGAQRYLKLIEDRIVNVDKRSIEGRMIDGRYHALEYISHVLPCIDTDGSNVVASYATPIAYRIDGERVI